MEKAELLGGFGVFVVTPTHEEWVQDVKKYPSKPQTPPLQTRQAPADRGQQREGRGLCTLVAVLSNFRSCAWDFAATTNLAEAGNLQWQEAGTDVPPNSEAVTMDVVGRGAAVFREDDAVQIVPCGFGAAHIAAIATVGSRQRARETRPALFASILCSIGE